MLTAFGRAGSVLLVLALAGCASAPSAPSAPSARTGTQPLAASVTDLPARSVTTDSETGTPGEDPAEAAARTLVVEIHVPLDPAEPGAGTPGAFPWIPALEDYLHEREDAGDCVVWNEGEEVRLEFVYAITLGSRERLLAVARDAVHRDGVPKGAYALLTDSDHELTGEGEKVPL